MILPRISFCTLILLLSVATISPAQNLREKKVREDKQKVEADGYWLYNDLPSAFAESKKTKKPMIVILRCIPCEECVKLDDDLVNTDPRLKPLLDQFVRVRVVSTNGLDLSLFAYDYDQSFAVFLLNADGTIYGRFGTRSHRTNWIGDVSIDGLAKALRGALDLHAEYPKNKSSLEAKQKQVAEFPVPEQFPSLKGKYTSKLNYAGNVVQSCIHCHQIADAQKDLYRQKREPIPESVLFPYPHPKTLGFTFNPKERATLSAVETGSLAEKAGFKSGDVIRTLNGQVLLSIADVQWVLHHLPADGGSVTAEVVRGEKTESVTLKLPTGWRRASDLSWRSSSWGLRRMSLGGLLLETLEAAERPAGLSMDSMALRIKHVGQYGPHATAKNAGFQVGDVILAYDGKTNLLRETDVLAYGVTERKAGDKVVVTVLRNGKKRDLTLPLPE